MSCRLCFAILPMALVAVSSAQTFVNPGFETGDFTGWTLTATTNGQTSVQNVQAFDIDGAGPLGSSLAGRFGVGRINTSTATGGIMLTQNLALTGGVTYSFGYMWATQNTGANSNADGGRFSWVVDGQILTGSTQLTGSIATNTTVYGVNTVQFTPTTTGTYSVGAHIVRGFTPPATLHQYVDNFTAVPEPASFAALSLGVLALARRRKQPRR